MHKNLTILFIHHGQGIGGACMSLLYLVQGLLEKGHTVRVLFLQNSEAFTLFKNSGIECIGPLGISDFSHTVVWWYKWYNIKSFCKAVVDNLKVWLWLGKEILSIHRPDILHLNTSSLFVWAAVAKKLGIPVVCHIREPIATGYLGLRRAIVVWAIKKYCDSIVPISINEGRPWKNLDKVTVLYNAVPENFARSTKEICEKKKTYKTILFLGGMSEQKGTLLILQALEIIIQHSPSTKLVIAGRFYYETNFLKKMLRITSFSRYSSAVKKLVERLGQNIEFKGVCQNVPELIQKCDLLVFPAQTGHFARPIIEAGFCHKPVVATNLPPLDELVIDGKTGFLVQPKAEDLAEKILSISNNDSLAQSMGRNNYIFCKKNFCLTTQINRITSVYRNTLKGEENVEK